MTIRLSLATIKRILPLLMNVFVTGVILIILELLVDYTSSNSTPNLQDLMLKITVLGVLNSCVLISLYYFTKELKRWALWMALIGGVLVVINILFTIFAPTTIDSLGVYINRYAILWGTYLMFLIVLPIWNLRKTAEAWYFLSRIFIVGLFTILVTGILEVGLTAALAALTTLFGIVIGPHTWVILGIIVMYMVSQLLFWSLMPGNLDEGLNMTNYPKFLLRLSQFGLLPLATVYVIILYAYSISILVTGNLPSNQIVYMVVGFLVPNLIALIFLLPLARERIWVRVITVTYSVLSLPLVGLLFYGITLRIADVGLSIDRALVTLLGIWFACAYIYILLGRWVKPQVILFSLPLLLVFASFMPIVNIFSLTEISQASRLVTILDEKGYIQKNVLVAKSTPVDYDYYAEVVDIVQYLNLNFGLGSIKNLFANLPAGQGLKFDQDNVVNDPYALISYYINTSEPYYGNDITSTDLTRSYYSSHQDFISVEGYTDLIQVSYYGGGYAGVLYFPSSSGQDIDDIKFDDTAFEIVIFFKDTSSIRVDLQDMVDQNSDVTFMYGSSYDANMTLEVTQDEHKVKIVFSELTVGINDTEQITSVHSFTAQVLGAIE